MGAAHSHQAGTSLLQGVICCQWGQMVSVDWLRWTGCNGLQADQAGVCLLR